MSLIVPSLITLFIVLVIGGLFGAVVFRAAAKWVLKTDVPFLTAFATVFFSIMVSGALSLFARIAVERFINPEPHEAILQTLAIVAGVLIQAAAITVGIKVTYGKALLVSLTMLGIWIGVFVIVSLIVYGVLWLIQFA